MSDESTQIVTMSCRAMATRFEFALWGGERARLLAAADEAMAEVARIEGMLSYFLNSSEIFEINAIGAHHAVTVTPELFRLLQRAIRLSQETEGAFDITVAPLLQAWGFEGADGHMADPQAVHQALEITGYHHLLLDESAFTVALDREGVTVDLGALGKGYAIERAADILREIGISGALIHGGTSTVQAVGTQPDGSGWPIAIQSPTNPAQRLTTVTLIDTALSVSAVHGKSFSAGDTRYGHVMDPRTGQPVRGANLSAVLCDSATESDALSTALLVLGPSFLSSITEPRPLSGALVVWPEEGGDYRAHSIRM